MKELKIPIGNSDTFKHLVFKDHQGTVTSFQRLLILEAVSKLLPNNSKFTIMMGGDYFYIHGYHDKNEEDCKAFWKELYAENMQPIWDLVPIMS